MENSTTPSTSTTTSSSPSTSLSDQDHPPQPPLRHGASAGAADDSLAAPMLTYLDHHDEEAREYNCDADEAMSILGIKRSRLTQISGKSLRCARVKMSRYTRPMFRRCDLEEYKKLLRVPQSHIASSNLITQATDELQKSARELTASLASQGGVLSKIIEETLSQMRLHYDEQQKEWWQLFEGLHQQNQHTYQRFASLEERYTKHHRELKARLDRLELNLEQNLERSLKEPSQRVLIGLDKLSANRQETNHHLNGLHLNAQSNFRELMALMRQSYKLLRDDLRHISHQIRPSAHSASSYFSWHRRPDTAPLNTPQPLLSPPLSPYHPPPVLSPPLHSPHFRANSSHILSAAPPKVELDPKLGQKIPRYAITTASSHWRTAKSSKGKSRRLHSQRQERMNLNYSSSKAPHCSAPYYPSMAFANAGLYVVTSNQLHPSSHPTTTSSCRPSCPRHCGYPPY